jgi:hypothetical protein
MNTAQLSLEFVNQSARKHNTADNTMHAVKYQEHFASQAQWVCAQLLMGRRLTGRIAREEYHIEDVRARMHTLKKMGIQFSSARITGGCKEYFMTEEQILINKNI